MWFCDQCGRLAEGGDPEAGVPPTCTDHGPRWRLIRNAPCAAAVVVRDGLVLLGRRAREPFVGMWEVPGGFVERGEHPADAAVREVREELGIHVVLTGLVGIYLECSSRGESLLITCYAATTDDVDAVTDLDEVSEWGWFAPADIPLEMAGRHRLRIDDWLAGRTVGLPGDGR